MGLRISSLDAAIIVLYLAVTVLIGLWLGGRGKTTRDYFLGNRELPWWALLLSIVATETSTVTFLSVPGKSFPAGGNFGFLQLALGFIVGRLVVAWWFIPQYFQGTLSTSYELLQSQLGSATRRLASLLFLLASTVGDALRLFLAALVLENVMHLDRTTCIIAVGGVAVVYTFLGGLKSVVWNDCLQFVIYIAGAAFALAVMCQRLPGGAMQVLREAKDAGKLWMIDPGWQENSGSLTIWVGLIGGGFLALASHGTDHLIVQRLLGARSQADASRALVLSGVVVFFQFALFLAIGLSLSSYYAAFPPDESFALADEVFVSFIAHELPRGAVGLILAAVFAAAMSTQSSSLNASASVAVNDFYRPWLKPEASELHLLLFGKVATVVFGCLQIAIAIAAGQLPQQQSTVDNVLQIAAFASGPILGLFFLAMGKQRGDSVEALPAFACGLAVIGTLKWMSLGSDPWIVINGLWYAAIGSIVTWGVGRLIRALRP